VISSKFLVKGAWVLKCSLYAIFYALCMKRIKP
jgi:hypothetical protein